ncbi:penicillin-binding protein 1A [Polymorphobacter multimanifer]|uniref:Penicillin-binding protein 1A n=2 Tax=Polymorphobacter multimanifer TaxID=1070431 RepID=A0A841L7T7_9SPHN|nr:PBP1A family penicillin-binding protein [Polymorphobacter multimanifer]MBB6225925.1 penicillin-binding protein 1A [Polymorphobacter multimanifer]
MRRWLILGGVVLLVLAGLGAVLVASVLRDLPGEDELARYAPALPSTVRDVNGEVVSTFMRERRIYLPYNEIPPQLVQAYVSAEDKSFFSHGGLDYLGIVGAVFTNIESQFTGRRPVGASTITQQVAKGIIGNEVTLTRKLREAVVAYRLESVFSKQQILEIYLNQIFLGRNAYGVEAAAQAYFGKPASGLNLAEMAYLAILPKAPSTYSPVSQQERALGRRAYVLGRMEEDGHITAAERAAANATPLVAVANRGMGPSRAGDYFIEDVRRLLIDQFGEDIDAADKPGGGRNSVYGGGLWIRTSLDPMMQDAAEDALRGGLVRFERGRAWRGPAATIEIGDGWPSRLARTMVPTGYDSWRKAVVLARAGSGVTIGFTDGSEATLPAYAASLKLRNTNQSAAQAMKPGDVIVVTKAGGNGWQLRQAPEISGGFVAEDPHTGRVFAMVGGFDARAQSFNRATQAKRQPGSTFKPIVYATALDNGFTPSSIVVDGPFCVFQTRRLGQKCFRNFGGSSAGPQTLRWGLEQSRNLMTVRLGYSTGMDKVAAQAKALGIGDYPAQLAFALGAGETTVMKLTNAYAQLFNAGRKLEPSLIDMVQDRDGKVIYRRDTRSCVGCVADDWNGEAMPRPSGRVVQVIDPRTAYQTVHLMEGVVTRGTATRLRVLERPLAGKTGTTSGPKDAWFIGGTQDLVAGLYLGYDQPRNLGGYVQGGNTAGPIWLDFAKVALKDAEKRPFVIPPGIRMVRIDRRSGKRVFGAWPTGNDPKAGVIWEAFKPDSEPRRVGASGARRGAAAGGRVRSDAEFLSNSGGIY